MLTKFIKVTFYHGQNKTVNNFTDLYTGIVMRVNVPIFITVSQSGYSVAAPNWHF